MYLYNATMRAQHILFTYVYLRSITRTIKSFTTWMLSLALQSCTWMLSLALQRCTCWRHFFQDSDEWIFIGQLRLQCWAAQGQRRVIAGLRGVRQTWRAGEGAIQAWRRVSSTSSTRASTIHDVARNKIANFQRVFTLLYFNINW